MRQIRRERHWTQEALAHGAGMHWTYIGGIERGERNPSWENVVKLAHALGLSISELAARAEQLAE